MYRIAEDIICFAIKNSIPNKARFVKKIFDPEFNLATIQKSEYSLRVEQPIKREKSLNVFEQIDSYIESKQKKVSGATIDVYHAMKYHQLEFLSNRRKVN